MLQFQFRVIIIKISVYSLLYACSLTHALIHASMSDQIFVDMLVYHSIFCANGNEIPISFDYFLMTVYYRLGQVSTVDGESGCPNG